MGQAMRILMLGWEFPPYISGGLGTACYGLTRALAQRGHRVTFVLPKHVDGEIASHVNLLTPQDRPSQPATGTRGRSAAPGASQNDEGHRTPGEVASTFEYDPPVGSAALPGVTFKAVPSRIASPYGGGPVSGSHPYLSSLRSAPGRLSNGATSAQGVAADDQEGASRSGHPVAGEPSAPAYDPDHCAPIYTGDLPAEARRYADLCVDLARGGDFDVIHAHDWLTFPAAQAVSAATGRPWVAHVHSTEHDRSGEQLNEAIAQIERAAVHRAGRVIAVSHLTRNILCERYGMAPARCEVVYNGVEQTVRNGVERQEPIEPPTGIGKDEKVVLFLGRVTMQKGPEYFVAAAKRVLEKMDNVKFVIAGAGDQIDQTIRQASAAGIGKHVTFTGFLHGDEVAQAYERADVFVMPSVSEPFGIAPLEAVAHDVPVIISKQSGVSEVLTHALKVDFWDIDDIADKIIGVLRHPSLGQTMRKHADLQVRKLTWSGAAERCGQVYNQAGA
ncbi:glycosyltransferase [Phycisphaeraceae bacterium D3-23]